jgi:hypothetical protein
MYEIKKIGKVFTSKFVGTGPSSYEKRIYLAAVSQMLRNTGLNIDERKFIELRGTVFNDVTSLNGNCVKG